MIATIRNKIIALYHAIISSIAFYPSLIATGLFLLSLGLLWMEGHTDLGKGGIYKNLPFLISRDASTVRVLLSTLIGGVISLTVFSFSMVMIVLNQASSNFSPRLLPGLISDKRNQVVLGIYIGTIIFNLIILINLPAEGQHAQMGLSILTGIVLGVICLVLFILFIHNVSTSIQVQNIINRIYLMTRKRLHAQISKERREAGPAEADFDNWYHIRSNRAGYFEDVDLLRLKQLATEYDTDFKVVPYKGKYLLPNIVTVLSREPLDEDKTSNVLKSLLFTGLRKPSSNYMYGIQEIVEVGVKAMSPGINDPGTAVMTIDFLSELLALRMQLDALEVYTTEDESHQIELTTISFSELLHQTLSAYRLYCRHDVILMEKLIRMLNYLSGSNSVDPLHHEIIQEQMAIFAEDIREYISNKEDQRRLKRLLSND